MARGRMVTTQVAQDLRLNSISVDAALVFLMAIPQLDRDGLILAGQDGTLLHAKVCPLRREFYGRMPELIKEWAEAINPDTGLGLVVTYHTPNGMALYFPGFPHHNHLRYDREGESILPCPPGWVRIPKVGPVPAAQAGAYGSAADAGPIDSAAMAQALAHACKLDLKLKRAKVDEVAQVLVVAGYTPDDVNVFEAWWLACFWKGQKGETPELLAVPEKIAEARDWNQHGRPIVVVQRGRNGSNGNAARKAALERAQEAAGG
jgi:hypothetical protein